MRTLFCFFLLFNFWSFSEQSDGNQNYRHDEAKDDAYQKDDKLEDKGQNQHFIIRPCSYKDINCIRGFFAHYSQCSVAEGPVPDPYVLHLLPDVHIPHANLTYKLVNPEIKGLNKFKIEEFYINKATDKLVMEVVFDKIVVACPEAKLKYHRKGKEPLEVVDYTVIEYEDVSFTLTIPHVKELQLSRGNVYTYINNPYPKYTLGPATYSSKDPGFIKAVAELQLKVGLSLQEAFVTQGPVFFAAFFRSSICVSNYYDDWKNYWKNLHVGLYRANVKKQDDHQPHRNNHNSTIQPCQLQDLTCIRRVFAQNSKCKPVEGPAQDPYMIERLDLPIPQANLTFTLLNAQVKGLNEWKIKNFYINKATDRLVLEVVFDRIVVASPGATTSCHRKGKEPVEVTDYSIIEYYGISFTLTIPNIKDLQLAKGHVFTYVTDANPLYTLGPAVHNEKDPDFIKCIAVWLDRLGVTMQEVWETQGPAFLVMFLHSNICDFRNN